MKKSILGVVGVVLGLTVTTFAVAAALGPQAPQSPDAAATQRYYAGVITAVDAASVTISGKTAVTGKVDSSTVVTIDGNRARPSDLRLTSNAKAEIGLNDVWASIAVSTK